MPEPSSLTSQLLAVVERHWGFRSLRPLQEPAMRAVLDGRDSLVVLPTGGGKSLCYQAPAVLRGDTTVVISPLISLMKDQVDGLRECGVEAVQIDSMQSAKERFAAEVAVHQGEARLVFVSPERLVNTDFYRTLQRANVKTFAIDEAHCISHWGHDFRPEYRQLIRLRDHFPDASLHAYTATATERVRRDIITQLGLRDPEVLVGNFDRPNLIYRVLPRRDYMKQVLEVVERHPNEAGIIYCIRRADVDSLTMALQKHGHRAMPYHAGLDNMQRKATQDAFSQEKCDLIVATVAVGMGIDRSNIRFVLHAAMPKSVEHYQQETGRAGRDGLEAECVLLYSAADTILWKSIQEKSAEEAGAEPEFVAGAISHINDMDRYSRGAVCRHRALVEYFGQSYDKPSCEACDICLNETETVPDATVIAQKILSCVARVREMFGIGHLVSVLRGEDTEGVRKWRHQQLSTYGILKDCNKAEVRDWVYQLLGQGALVQAGDEYPVLKLNPASWEVMRGQRQVRLVRIARKEKGPKVAVDAASWEGVDTGLFEVLRKLRWQVAQEQHVEGAYLIFTDVALRDMARIRPTTPENMLRVTGVGEVKLKKYGDRFLAAIRDHCKLHGLTTDVAPKSEPRSGPVSPPRPNPIKEQAFQLFAQGNVIEDVMHQTGRSRSTVVDYLAQWIRENHPPSIKLWIADDLYNRIAEAVRQVSSEKLKPIFVFLGEKVSYDEIRLVVAHLDSLKGAPPEDF